MQWIAGACTNRLRRRELSNDRRLENVLKADPSKQFGARPIGNSVDDGGPIIIRIEVDPQRTLAKGGLYDLRYGAGDTLRVCILR